MERRIDEMQWHCSPHPCGHDEPDLPLTWRYSVVAKDYALSLYLSKSGGEFRMHRTFETAIDGLAFGDPLATAPSLFKPCDLLGTCVLNDEVAPAHVSGPRLSPALLFWTDYGVGGRREQPEKFWRALERRARTMARDLKKGRYLSTHCPRCRGSGSIVVKPKQQKGA
jgi:hypothetical protein